MKKTRKGIAENEENNIDDTNFTTLETPPKRKYMKKKRVVKKKNVLDLDDPVKKKPRKLKRKETKLRKTRVKKSKNAMTDTSNPETELENEENFIIRGSSGNGFLKDLSTEIIVVTDMFE